MALSLAAFLCSCCCCLLIVVVDVPSLASVFSRCRCIIHGGGGVSPPVCLCRLWRVVAVDVVGVLLSLLAMCYSRRLRPLSWLIFSALGPCHLCRHQRLVVVVGASLLLAASLFVVFGFSLP